MAAKQRKMALRQLSLLVCIQTARGLSVQRPLAERRELFGAAVALVVAPRPAAAAAAAPIAVIGSSGRTGSLCVAACLRRGLAVRALSRAGSCPPGVDATDPKLKLSACDVRDPASLRAAVGGAGAVIYAASGSKKGGSPHEVDNEGVVAAADACVKGAVPRY